MKTKCIIPCLYFCQGQAVTGRDEKALFSGGDVQKLAEFYSDSGADELLLYDLSSTEEEHEEAIGKIKNICRFAQLPVAAAGNISRVEDVKKLLYAGCQRVVLNFSKDSNRKMLEEVSNRFGKEKIAVCILQKEELLSRRQQIQQYAGAVLIQETVWDKLKIDFEIPIILDISQDSSQKAMDSLKNEQVWGISGTFVSRTDHSLMEFKRECRAKNIAVNIFESKIAWSDFKLNSDGLIPVVVQDYQTDEVLMLAYMNEEAFQTTLQTGKMTYWSRSRRELWTKGMTSGHVQYMKSLTLDCDNDTILAKVAQVGAACHTGSRTCFFQELAKKEYDDTNPLKVFQDVYQVILDRKEHPKEGSYTNYLFDKGIDKILKKVGEECTEIVIAAKNPDKEEIKYEIADFLYHVMVLMAEKEVSWEDIVQELARR